MSDLIPCSVQVLTRNSMPGIQRCLESLTAFEEVIVQDGGSTDGTRELARSFANVRLMDQDSRFLNEEGRITDFAAMRNLSIQAARYDWIFVVDGDERVDPDLVREVASIVLRNDPGVFQAFRRFYVDGQKIMRCAGYPAYQIRLFHRALTHGYGKAVHERLMLKPGVTVRTLAAELPVPLPPAAALEPKFHRYLLMEARRQRDITWGRWVRWILLRNLRSALSVSIRVALIWLTPGCGKRMPIVYDWQAARHSLQTIAWTFPPIVRRMPGRENV